MTVLTWETPAGQVFWVEFDATTSEQIRPESEIVTHPTETGSIVDAALDLGWTVTISGVVSQYPSPSHDRGTAERAPAMLGSHTLDIPSGADVATVNKKMTLPEKPALLNPTDVGAAIIGAIVGGGAPELHTVEVQGWRANRVLDLVAFSLADGTYRPAEVLDLLETARVSAYSCTVISPVRSIGGLLIQSIQVSRETSLGTSAEFTIELRSAQIVSSETTDTASAGEPTAQRRKITTGAGEEVDPSWARPRSKSLLRTLVDGLAEGKSPLDVL